MAFVIPDVDYKFLTADGRGPCSDYKWPLPKMEDGKWVAPSRRVIAKRDLVMCGNGVHAPARDNLLAWAGEQLFAAEYGGECIEQDDKSCYRWGRLLYKIESWNPQTQRLLAAEYAERVLPLFERRHPKDMRPHEAIQAARRYAFGLIDYSALSGAARAAGAAEAARAARAAERQAQHAILMRALWDTEAWLAEQREMVGVGR